MPKSPARRKQGYNKFGRRPTATTISIAVSTSIAHARNTPWLHLGHSRGAAFPCCAGCYARCVFDPRLRPPVLLDRVPTGAWPEPHRLPSEGLGGVGGSLAPVALLSAYQHGYFPCYGSDTPRLWWNPDPRAVFRPGDFHVAHRLHRRVRRRDYQVTWNRRFQEVMLACDEGRADGSWIVPEIVDAYVTLHEMGRAYSLEIEREGRLIGGVYGVQLGALFAAESMFHRETDASKLALGHLLASLFAAGIELVDVQYRSPHLASLGAIALPRAEYVSRLTELSIKAIDLRAIELKDPPTPRR